MAAYLIKPLDSATLLDHARRAIERYRCFKAVAASRQRLLQTTADLERIETSLRSPGGGSSPAPAHLFLDLTLENAAQSLLDLRRLMAALHEQPQNPASKDWLQSSRPVVLLEALWETIAVFEQTKGSFKSKELGQLRKKLEGLVRETRPPRS